MAATRQLLAETVVWYQSQAWAPTTNKTYASQIKAYYAFCRQYNFIPVPAPPQQLSYYIAHLGRRLSYASIKQYLNAVRLLHESAGTQAPLHEFSVRLTLRGLKRVKGDCPNRKAPITPQLLFRLLQNLDLSRPLHAAVYAAGLTLFFGVLRRANLIPPIDAPFDNSRHLRRRDVTINNSGATLLIRWTKTNQFRNKITILPLPRLPGHLLCPTQAIKHYFDLTSTADPDGPAWVIPGRKGLTPITPRQFVTVVKAALKDYSTNIGGHSFRRGGATWLRQCGVDIPLIKEIGDWATDAYMRYVVTPSSNIGQTIRVAAQTLPNYPQN